MLTHWTRHSPKIFAGTQRVVRLRFAASDRKANVCRLNRGVLVLIRYWLDTHESRKALCGSSIKKGETLHTLD